MVVERDDEQEGVADTVWKGKGVEECPHAVKGWAAPY